MFAKKIAIGACAAVLAAAGGIAVSQGNDSSVAAATTSGQTRGPGGAPGAQDLSALAKDLGVSTARLQEAMASSRPSSPTAGGRSDMAATLAKSLGLSTATVQKALNANAPGGGTTGAPPSGGTPPSAGGAQTRS